MDLPQVPSNLVDQSWVAYNQWLVRDQTDIINPHVLDKKNYGRNLYKNGQLHGYSTGFGLQSVSEQLETWVRDNIVPEFRYAGIGASTPNKEHSGPHRDQSRNYALIYQLKSGGPDSCTVFYREKQHDPDKHFYYENYDNLEVIDTIYPKLEQWYLMDTQVIHSVENIVDGRMSIQISMTDNQVPKTWIS